MNKKSVATVFATVILLGVSACAEGSSSARSSDMTAAQQSCVDDAKKVLEQATEQRPAELHETPPPVEEVRGKSVWFIAASLTIPVVKEISEGFEDAATAAGLKPTIYDGQGNVDTWNSGLQAAVNAHADGIVLHGIDPTLVSAPLAAAQNAGIRVIDSTNGSPDAPLQDGIEAHVSGSYKQGGTWAANYAMVESNCQGTIGVFYPSIYKAQVEYKEAAQAEIEAKCPDCELKTQDIAGDKLATGSGPVIQAFVRRFPDMQVVITGADSIASLIVPPLEQIQSKVKVVGWEGADQNLQWIKDGNVQTATTVFPPTAMLGWLQVDQLMRLVGGQPPVMEDFPIHFTTTDTIGDMDDERTANADFEAVFKKYWGVS